MAKRPLLRGDWVTPAAAIFLAVAFSTDLSVSPAHSQEAEAAGTAPAAEQRPAAQEKPADKAQERAAGKQPGQIKSPEHKPQKAASPQKPEEKHARKTPGEKSHDQKPSASHQQPEEKTAETPSHEGDDREQKPVAGASAEKPEAKAAESASPESAPREQSAVTNADATSKPDKEQQAAGESVPRQDDTAASEASQVASSAPEKPQTAPAKPSGDDSQKSKQSEARQPEAPALKISEDKGSSEKVAEHSGDNASETAQKPAPQADAGDKREQQTESSLPPQKPEELPANKPAAGERGAKPSSESEDDEQTTEAAPPRSENEVAAEGKTDEQKPSAKSVIEEKAGNKPETPVAEPKPVRRSPVEAKAAEKPAEPAPTKAVEPKPLKPEKPKDVIAKPDEAGDLALRASTVDAVYQISWLGTHIGDFRIKSSITPRQYSLQASANLSVFFGTFVWQGSTTSSGQMTAAGPVPQNYTFSYATSNKRESVELKFQKKMVQDISINPPQYPTGRYVPITASHLTNVLDPLSAIVLLSQAKLTKGEPCNKRLPIFDGKIRYDLVFSPKGMRTVKAAGKLQGTAYVCSVRFVPVAGHRMGRNNDNDYAAGNTGIEVWLVPVPEAGLIVPYYVHVPTPAGTASMVTAKFDVQIPAGRHALAE